MARRRQLQTGELLDRGPRVGSIIARGIATVPYFALASGFLTGKYRRKADTGGAARGGAVGGR